MVAELDGVPEIEEHEFDASGVTADGECYTHCACGWRSAMCTSSAEASEALQEHIRKANAGLL